MSNQTNHSFSSVISINPYKETYLNGISSFLTQSTSPEYKKSQYAISYINAQGFINSQVSISKNIPTEDLHDAITNKVYDELGLDQAVTYQIQFIESFNNLDENNRTFHVFIVDPLTLSQTFEPIVEQVRYLDVIIPSPLLLKSLYSKEIIDSHGVHCFVYFQENETFVTVYNEKEFVYTKSIKYSFKLMHERFCEIYGERVEFEEFMEFVTLENLKDTTSDFKEYFIKLYKEIFSNINDILTYVKRAFEIDKIDKVYIGSQVETVTKLDEMAEVELKIKSIDFAFDYGYESDSTYIDQLHALMHLYTTLPENEKYNCNFTIFHRPPKFIQRQSGKLLLLTAASFILAFIYPLSYWTLSYIQELRYVQLENEYKSVNNEKTTREATIKNLEADKAKVLALLAQEEKDYKEKKSTLVKIHEVKVNYPMKAKILERLTRDLNQYGVRLETLLYGENDTEKVFYFGLVASNDEKVTRLLEYLTKVHERTFKFSIEKIFYEEASKSYFGELKVEIL